MFPPIRTAARAHRPHSPGISGTLPLLVGYTGIPDPEGEYDWRIFALQWADDHRLGSRAWAVLLFLAGRPSADPMPC